MQEDVAIVRARDAASPKKPNRNGVRKPGGRAQAIGTAKTTQISMQQYVPRLYDCGHPVCEPVRCEPRQIKLRGMCRNCGCEIARVTESSRVTIPDVEQLTVQHSCC